MQDKLNELIRQMQSELKKWIEKKKSGVLTFKIAFYGGGIRNCEKQTKGEMIKRK